MQSEILIIDIETTGLVPKGATWENEFQLFPHVVQISWIFEEQEKDFIIKPEGWIIPAEVSEIHGITQERAESEGVYFLEVVKEIANDATRAAKIAGHNLYFDLSIIKANVLKFGLSEFLQTILNPAFDKSKRIDTMNKTIKFVGAKFPDSNRLKFPRLEELYFKLFSEEFPAHNALEDCRAVKRCLPELIQKGIIQL